MDNYRDIGFNVINRIESDNGTNYKLNDKQWFAYGYSEALRSIEEKKKTAKKKGSYVRTKRDFVIPKCPYCKKLFVFGKFDGLNYSLSHKNSICFFNSTTILAKTEAECIDVVRKHLKENRRW